MCCGYHGRQVEVDREDQEQGPPIIDLTISDSHTTPETQAWLRLTPQEAERIGLMLIQAAAKR